MPDDERQMDVNSDEGGTERGAATDLADTPQAEAAELESARNELQEARDSNLRLMAELRNVQQRAQRDKAESLRYAEADFARDLLPVIDDLERTLESARASADAAALVEGVRITREHLLKVLKSRGIEPVPAVGEPFDPHVHQAVAQQPSEQFPAGTVMIEVARGYKMHERVLRNGQVVVSSGRPQG